MRVPREGDLPLSFAQQRLWFLDQLEPGSAAYNMPFGVRLSGELNREALGRSLNEMVRRHEVLRTHFAFRHGSPVQVIGSELEVKIEEIDLRALQEPEREVEALRLGQEEAAQPFDLSCGPLLRARLLRLAEQEHVLLVTMHHVVSDGWSVSIMAREISRLYEAYVRGEESRLPELKIQYADFAVWQRQWLQGEVLEQQLQYWRWQLADLEPLDLPTDHVRPAVMSQQGSSVSFSLPSELSKKLKELSQREGVTLFMSLLAAFQVTLSKYAGQRDIAVGTVVANRNRVEVEDLIGFFVNTLVLRTELSGNPSFAEVLKRARQVTLNAYQHQDVPFEKLVEELQPGRDLGRSPLFQVMLLMGNTGEMELHLPGLRLSSFAAKANTTKFDLSLAIEEEGAETAGRLSYATGLFENQTAGRLLEHLRLVLERMVAAPAFKIDDLVLLTAQEREQVLVEWNRTAVENPRRYVHQMFEAQAAVTPQALAVEFEGQRLSYADLNRRANQLAHYIKRMGVGPEVKVGICMHRSPRMIVALVAVLKAGGAYVPLDPEYPTDRLQFMVEDSEARVLLTEALLTEALLTEAGMIAKLPPTRARRVLLDRDWERIADESEDNLPAAQHDDNLAYVIYTSGSTGRPKGVGVAMRGLVNLVHWHFRRYQFGRHDRMAQYVSTSFDVAVWEVWATLAAGASLHIVSEAVRPDPAALLQWMTASRITHIFVVSPMAEALLKLSWPQTTSLRFLLTGADKLHAVDGPAHPFPLVNNYGPTECTVVATAWDVPWESRQDPPIGSPIENTQVYVVDHALQPVPVGVAGELCIAGEGLARGYLNRPDLTVERFVPNPFSATPGARMYRTGDRCRWGNDGALEYMGRFDHQVKVHGYRIELGEIESTLRAHPQVEQAVAVVRDERLIAYVVGRDRAMELSVPELREHLRECLPDYMVPAAIVPMAEMPLSPNGKIDRKALPEPEYQESEAQAGPRNPEEEILCGVFAAVLKQERVGIHQNFFNAGGHSLLATQVISRVRSAFNVELPLRALFEAPTVAELAERVRSVRGTGRVAPAIVRIPRENDLPLSFAQQRLWFLDQLEPGSSAYNMPFGMRLSGELDRQALGRSLNELVRRHEVLRTRFAFKDGSPVQLIAAEMEVKTGEIDLRGLAETEREAEMRRLAREEADAPFDLGSGPLLRVKLLQLDEQEHVLLVTMHHIVSDGWSTGIMIREFSRLYETYVLGHEVLGEDSRLPELEIQYADFAVWQRSWLQGEVLERQLEYWRRQLADLEPLDLPADHARPMTTAYREGLLPFHLDQELTAKLEVLSRQEGATLFMVLLAAFDVLLARYSGNQDVAVGTVIANRNHVSTEELIGFFVNTLVMRTPVDGHRSFRELLAQVRTTVLDAYEHQDVPFEKLVEELQPERNLSRQPFFQVMLALQNMEQAELQLPGLRLNLLESEPGSAKFDLMLVLNETAQGITGSFSYARELYDEPRMVRLLEHLRIALRELAATPEKAVGEISLLTESERRQLLEWNQTGQEYPHRSVVELFEQQVRRAPGALAVEYDGQQCSYQELNIRANQLARYLQEMGAKPEELVGICVERSLDSIVGLLAILKTGAAYLPLDPGYPAERLRFMLNDAGVRVLLTQDGLLRDLESCTHLTCVDMKKSWSAIAERSSQNLEVEIAPHNLAYAIYTSGSTGQPKGTLIQHQAITRLVLNTGYVQIRTSNRIAQASNLSFDAATFEVWGALLNGASLTVIARETAMNARELGREIVAKKVDIMFLTTALFNEVAREDANAFQGFECVLFGGEAVDPQWPRRVLDAAAPRSLCHVYGPTETTTFSSWFAVDEVAEDARTIPIGQPIANARLYVLDEQPGNCMSGERVWRADI
ncbi:MAG: amino acid adenylation domain-containing protein [Acidobacteriia bacterium]|nr:amino acid adenylation domain-containing protein [Terriglobia bacterium]